MQNSFEVAVPEENAVSDSNKFVYKVDGDQIVIYNRVEISAAEAGNIEFSYLTSKRTTEYVDMQQFAGPEADLTVTNGSTTVTKSVSGPSVAINTAARITAAEKRVPTTLYSEWQNSWGEKPADADDYYFLIWEVRTTISNGTQPYTFQLDDSFVNEEADLVGYRLQGATQFSDINTAEDQTAVSRYDYVLTRHSKAKYTLQDPGAYSREDFTLSNSVTVTVTPKDGVDESSARTAKQNWVY